MNDRQLLIAATTLAASPAFTLAQGQEPTIAGQEAAPAGDPAQGAPGGQPQAAPGGLGLFLPMILLFFVIMMVMTSMGQRKERKKQQHLLSSITRNDLVQTVGGVIGTVAEVSDKEVLLRVDDNTNARVRFAKSAVQTVLSSRSGSTGQTEHSESPEPQDAELQTAGHA